MSLTKQQHAFMQRLTSVSQHFSTHLSELIELGRIADNRDYSSTAIDADDLAAEFEITLEEAGNCLALIDELESFMSNSVGVTGKTGYEIIDIVRGL